MHYNTSIVLDYYKEVDLTLLPEYAFTDEREWRFDFADPISKVAIEVQGGIFTGGRHSRGAGMKADFEKYNEAAAQGWRVLQVIPQELCMDDFRTIVERAIRYVEVASGKSKRRVNSQGSNVSSRRSAANDVKESQTGSRPKRTRTRVSRTGSTPKAGH